MIHRLARYSLAASLSLALAFPALASNADDEAEARLALLNAHAGESVDRVTFLRSIDSYEVVGKHNLLLWETPSKAWLVDLRESPACRHLERDYMIGIDTFTDSINTRNSYIVGRGGLSCRVDRLREVDVVAWRTAERVAGIRE